MCLLTALVVDFPSIVKWLIENEPNIAKLSSHELLDEFAMLKRIRVGDVVGLRPKLFW